MVRAAGIIFTAVQQAVQMPDRGARTAVMVFVKALPAGRASIRMRATAVLRCVLLLFLAAETPGDDDTTATAQPARAPEAEWNRLDRENPCPPPYPARFVDSLLERKQFSFAGGLRTVDSVPFVKGEKFVYDVGWGPLRAGFVVLETSLDPESGRLVVTGRGLTNGFFSAFYTVRDLIRTSIDPKGMYPFFFEEHLREGRFRDDRWSLFDQAANRAYAKGNDTGFAECPPFVQNYFSLFAYIRAMSFAPGDSFSVDCFVHTKPFRIVSHCVERKPVAVEAGTFNCVLVKPVLVGKGRVFSKRDEIKLWLTDDAYRMPVEVSARIRVGTVTARLIWYERKE
jgi:Protein of unknown function (DUF3108)